MSKRILLTKNKVAIVDDEDYEWLNQWKWKYHKDNYGYRTVKYNKSIFMHRIINKTPDGLFTDHINREGLDNRKCNLRTVTRNQNIFNSKPRKNNTSGYKGVT